MLERLWRTRRPEQAVPSELVVLLDYTNYRGERGTRRVVPQRVWFGATSWHPQDGWLLEAYDVEKQAQRDFALSCIHSMTPETGEATADVLDRRGSAQSTGSVRISL